jgi:hypothetical protein
MAFMTVDDNETRELPSKARWSANKKLDAVIRLLRGEKLDEVSRELGVEARRLAARRDEFIDGGKDGSKGKDDLRWRTRRSGAPSGRAQDRRADHGQRDPASHSPKKGALDSTAEAAAVSTELGVPLTRICLLNGAPRSTICHRRTRGDVPRARPGPKTQISDDQLTETIRQVIIDCSFAAEGHRKV